MTLIHTLPRQALAALLTSLALLATTPAKAQEGPQAKLPTADLTAGMYVIHAELALTPAQQQTGMMFRRSMADNEGMLFVEQDSGVRCFWMRNTLIPLSIAFIGDDGTIVNIEEMQARSDASHCSAKPVRFALEMNQGWFSKRNLKPGLKLRGGAFSK